MAGSARASRQALAERHGYTSYYHYRVAQGEARGLSRRQAVGHPSKGEPSISQLREIGVLPRKLRELVRGPPKGEPIAGPKAFVPPPGGRWVLGRSGMTYRELRDYIRGAPSGYYRVIKHGDRYSVEWLRMGESGASRRARKAGVGT